MAYRGFFIDRIEEWSQFFEGCNWYTFHPIKIEIEDDRHLGGVEATFIILGLGFRVRWNYQETEEVQELLRRVEDIKSGDAATVIWEDDAP
jgi:hypothetical protein